MKNKKLYLLYILFCSLLLPCYIFSCYWVDDFIEIRSGLMGTNIIGIAGESAEEPYIEIIYSIADEDNPGNNKTASIMVTPPYLFQNDNVCIIYKYIEKFDKGGSYGYRKALIRNYEEGGADYLRIINHSQDKPVEFFLAGGNIQRPDDKIYLPNIWYKNAPLFFLLFPERKPSYNIHLGNGMVVYFEGDRIGDLTVTEAWSIEAVIDLYRAEYARSSEILLIAGQNMRIIDLIEGKILGFESYIGKIFYGVINPNEELQGSEKIGLLATPHMFFDEFESGRLR